MKKYMLVVLVGANMAFGVGNSPLVKPSQAKFRTQVVKTSNFDTAARLQDLELELAECSLKALKAVHPGQKAQLEKKCAELKAEIISVKGGIRKYWDLAKKGLIVTALAGLVATGTYFYLTDADANTLKQALVEQGHDENDDMVTPGYGAQPHENNGESGVLVEDKASVINHGECDLDKQAGNKDAVEEKVLLDLSSLKSNPERVLIGGIILGGSLMAGAILSMLGYLS